MVHGLMTDLILDRIRFRSTEIGVESESVPRSVRSLIYAVTISIEFQFLFDHNYLQN